MSTFTDAASAVEEAQYLADMTGWPHSIVSTGGVMIVVARYSARSGVLETVHPDENDMEVSA